ncbi:MAG: hypothetical protein K0S65_790 [Labilithrix sp.]|nr:hypothetical protein [Labilithrix sp.]
MSGNEFIDDIVLDATRGAARSTSAPSVPDLRPGHGGYEDERPRSDFETTLMNIAAGKYR